MLFTHGAAGGWDELVIAAVALAVLWVALKLAGRKAGTDDEKEETPAETATRVGDERHDSAQVSVPQKPS